MNAALLRGLSAAALAPLLCSAAPVSQGGDGSVQPLPPTISRRSSGSSLAAFHGSIAEPLSSLIAKGESSSAGGYDAANNGQAMDLGRSGIVRVFGRKADQVSVAEILAAQAQRLIHAVGRYQIIGSTLQQLVDQRCITAAQLFSTAVQDQAFLCLIQDKRPAVWRFITTGDGLSQAADALSMEWASMPYRNGRTFYSNGSDRAHATRADLLAALEACRQRYRNRNPEAHFRLA